MYDCLTWGGASVARPYTEAVRAVFRRDRTEWGYAATRAVLWNLAKVVPAREIVAP